jgi:hypothetical protein
VTTQDDRSLGTTVSLDARAHRGAERRSPRRSLAELARANPRDPSGPATCQACPASTAAAAVRASHGPKVVSALVPSETVARMPRLLLTLTMVGFIAVSVPADGFHTENVPAQWSLTKVSPSGRYIVVSALGQGGCEGTPQVAAVSETSTAVTLRVIRPQGVPDAGEAPAPCPAIPSRVITMGVRLSAPLAGRTLVGQARFALFRAAPGAAVPHLVGARAGDAMRALANVRIHSRLIGPVEGMVVRQSPPPRLPLRAAKGITLVAK